MKDKAELMARALTHKERDKNPAELIELYSTFFVLHSNLTVYSGEVNSPSFYEHHSFLNLMVAWGETSCYDLKERIKVLRGTIPSDIKDKVTRSLITNDKVAPTDPVAIYKRLNADLYTISEACSNIFQRNAKEGIAGTVALVTRTCEKADHYYWETGVMAGMWK